MWDQKIRIPPPRTGEKHGYLRDIAATASADMPIIAEIAAGCKRETGEGRNFTISGGKMKNAQKEGGANTEWVLVFCTIQLQLVIARSDSQESRRGNLSKPEDAGRELVTMSCTATRNWHPVFVVLLNIGEIPTSGVSGRLPRNDNVQRRHCRIWNPVSTRIFSAKRLLHFSVSGDDATASRQDKRIPYSTVSASSTRLIRTVSHGSRRRSSYSASPLWLS